MDASLNTAFVEQLLKRQSWLRSLARTLVLGDDRVDDAVQEVLLAAVKSPPRHAGNPRAWARRVMLNYVAGSARSEQAREQREKAVAPADAQEAKHEVELQRDLIKHVLALREPYQSAILLRFYRELTTEEIATRDGISIHTVRSRIKRALAMLRHRLDRERAGDSHAWHVALLPLAARARVPAVEPETVLVAGASSSAFQVLALVWRYKVAALFVACCLSMVVLRSWESPGDEPVATAEVPDIAALASARSAEDDVPVERIVLDLPDRGSNPSNAPRSPKRVVRVVPGGLFIHRQGVLEGTGVARSGVALSTPATVEDLEDDAITWDHEVELGLGDPLSFDIVRVERQESGFSIAGLQDGHLREWTVTDKTVAAALDLGQPLDAHGELWLSTDRLVPERALELHRVVSLVDPGNTGLLVHCRIDRAHTALAMVSGRSGGVIATCWFTDALFDEDGNSCLLRQFADEGPDLLLLGGQSRCRHGPQASWRPVILELARSLDVRAALWLPERLSQVAKAGTDRCGVLKIELVDPGSSEGPFELGVDRDVHYTLAGQGGFPACSLLDIHYTSVLLRSKVARRWREAAELDGEEEPTWSSFLEDTSVREKLRAAIEQDLTLLRAVPPWEGPRSIQNTIEVHQLEGGSFVRSPGRNTVLDANLRTPSGDSWVLVVVNRDSAAGQAKGALVAIQPERGAVVQWDTPRDSPDLGPGMPAHQQPHTLVPEGVSVLPGADSDRIWLTTQCAVGHSLIAILSTRLLDSEEPRFEPMLRFWHPGSVRFARLTASDHVILSASNNLLTPKEGGNSYAESIFRIDVPEHPILEDCFAPPVANGHLVGGSGFRWYTALGRLRPGPGVVSDVRLGGGRDLVVWELAPPRCGERVRLRIHPEHGGLIGLEASTGLADEYENSRLSGEPAYMTWSERLEGEFERNRVVATAREPD